MATQLQQLLGVLAALALPARYALLPGCWALYAWVLWAQPALRLPLLIYLAFILSPAGRRAVGTSRWPRVLRAHPLHRCFKHYAPCRLVKTAELDPARRYVVAGAVALAGHLAAAAAGVGTGGAVGCSTTATLPAVAAGHPHGVMGNCSHLALGTEAMGWATLFPGIRVSLGARRCGPGDQGSVRQHAWHARLLAQQSRMHPPVCSPAGTNPLILATPVAREICLLHGWCGVSRRTLLQRLGQGPGSAVALVVGGAAEAVLAEVRMRSRGHGSAQVAVPAAAHT